MKSLLLVAWLLTAGGGERERGLELYRAGKFAEAAAAFRAAIEHDGDAPDLQWNLALACWRAGELAAAETAAEKYAALAEHARVDLHRGLLGAVRFAEAQQLETEADAMPAGAAPPTAADPAASPPPDPLPVLERALEKATQAKGHFVAGAAANATPELLRNTERALRYVDELQKKIEELKRQREQQPQDDPKQDDPKQDDEKKDPKQDGEQQDQADQNQPGEPQPKPDETGEPQPKDGSEGQDGDQQQANGSPPEPSDEDRAKPAAPKGEDQSQPGQEPPPPPTHDQGQAGGAKGENRMDAPGEFAEGKELTPEQAQRLLEQLKQLDGRLRQLQRGNKSGRRPVGRDW